MYFGDAFTQTTSSENSGKEIVLLMFIVETSTLSVDCNSSKSHVLTVFTLFAMGFLILSTAGMV